MRTEGINSLMGAECQRLAADAVRRKNWKRWGPYLSERQWGTVREDYSADGNCWDYFPHEHARSRRYRWGEDGLLGITDRECRLCFALALWNGADEMLKERLFGLTNSQGNHGEAVKEYYYYRDSTPTHSYMKALYKYPQGTFPYRKLIEENARRSRLEDEYELADTGIFEHWRYFDVQAEYAKADDDDILIRLSITNRSSHAAKLHLLPTLWFRNTWSSGNEHEDWGVPQIRLEGSRELRAEHSSLGVFHLFAGDGPSAQAPQWLFTENQTNYALLFNAPNPTPYVKDAFDEYVVHGRLDKVNPARVGTKAAALYQLRFEPGQTIVLKLRLVSAQQRPAGDALGDDFDRVMQQRQAEADEFYQAHVPQRLGAHSRQVIRQAYAGLLWSRQFYYYVVKDWLHGDPKEPPPPPGRTRNATWPNIFNRNFLSMPDKWEYPWYAAWDLAFQAVAVARIDGQFAKEQLMLMLREWYMNPNGELPAYEFNFSDVNPPVHAWACWRVYKITAPPGRRDRAFLARAFQKLLLNFTWWVNRKDVRGRQVFAGGFLGMDNIGVFDRNRQFPQGSYLEQADGTAWMSFFCVTMLAIALELASEDPVYEDMASKFFDHFIAICDAMNCLGGTGLWDEQDGMYYDRLTTAGDPIQLRVRSIVSLIPLLAVEVLDDRVLGRYAGFRQRMDWFLEHRKDLARHISNLCRSEEAGRYQLRLLAIPSRDRLLRVLRYMLDEAEFLSPYGIRSLSKHHQAHPYIVHLEGREYRVDYEPGCSTTDLFGGNSNWRGPVWLPINYLLMEAMERYHHFYGESLKVECPSGSGRMMTLQDVACEIRSRLARIFLPGADGWCPWQGNVPLFRQEHWRDHILFNEYFHGETGCGLGASHQTGWTALMARIFEDIGRSDG